MQNQYSNSKAEWSNATAVLTPFGEMGSSDETPSPYLLPLWRPHSRGNQQHIVSSLTLVTSAPNRVWSWSAHKIIKKQDRNNYSQSSQS